MVEPAVTCPASLLFVAINCAGFFAPAPSSLSTSSFKFPVSAPSAIVAKIEKAASKAVTAESRIGLIGGSVSYWGSAARATSVVFPISDQQRHRENIPFVARFRDAPNYRREKYRSAHARRMRAAR